MELILMISTLKKASANRVTAIIPYFGYSRQDRKDKPRVPISCQVVSNLLESVGVDRVVTVDLHSTQAQGFFGKDVIADNLAAGCVGVEYLINSNKIDDFNNCVVVSPDAGGVYRAKQFQ